MMPQRSPTLVLAAEVDAARIRGLPAYSLSTPTFPERGASVGSDGMSTLLSPALGQDGLRKRCRQNLFAKWDLPHHETMITAGAKAAILSTLRAACEPGDRVLILAPSWPSYADIVRLLYLEPRFFETRFEEGFSIDPDALAAAADRCRAKVILLCNPGNPTGRIVPGPELDAVASVARDRDAVLLVDESFSNVVFAPERWRGSVCAGHERLVIVSSISKNRQLQGLRIGACLAQGYMLDDIVAAHQSAMSSAPSLSQSVALAMLRDPDQPEFGETRKLALALVDRQEWACAPSEGAFYIFPRVARIDEFEARARSRSVFLLRGEAFGRQCKDHFRLCFGKSPKEFREIVEALGLPQGSIRAVA